MKKIKLLLLFIGFVFADAKAVDVIVGTATNVLPASNVSVNVSVNNFANVAGFRFTVSYDPSVVQFSSIGTIGVPANFLSNPIGGNKVVIVWNNNAGSTTALPNGTVLFKLNFTAIGASGTSSPITIDNSLVPLEMVDGTSSVLPFNITNGLVSMAAGSVCPINGLVFTTQAQIDAFPTTYPGCTVMPYSITIRESVPGNITNLNGLSQLTEIQQSLEIQDNTALPNLLGLNALTTVGQQLLIRNNTNLMNLKGLFALSSVTGSLTIEGNPNLQTVEGLNGLKTIGNYCSIFNNPALTDISKLSLLTSIGGDFLIGQNNSLTSLNGLGALTTINGRLEITANNVLANISALGGITSIPGSLGISWNPLLVNLTGLNALKSIGSYLVIAQNTILQDISALSAVTYVGRTVDIAYNPALTNFTGLGGLTAINGDLLISYNATLASISSLGPITSIAGNLRIQGNAVLVNLTGLNYLTKLSGLLFIYDNAQLNSLTSLNALTILGGGTVTLDNNPTLTSLAGLNNINPLNITNLIIRNSGTLSYCGVKSICDYLSVPTNPATISSNATGCATRIEVSNSCCTTPSTPSVSSITPTSATVSWTAVSGTQGYTLEYKTNTATTWTVVSGIASSAISYIITGLTVSTAYNVRLKSICSATASSAYTTTNFTTTAYTLSGKVKTETGIGIKNVQMALKLTGTTVNTYTTDATGNYSFTLTPNTNYTIELVKNTNLVNGVTNADVIAINKHYLNILPLTSPYKIMAANVSEYDDNNSFVNMSDQIRVTLLINGNSNPFNVSSWSFIPQSHTFTTTLPAFPKPQPIYPFLINIATTTSNYDFIGMKEGDVTGDADPNQ